jgi:predicted GIY-YIG superfamily endonuclease
MRLIGPNGLEPCRFLIDEAGEFQDANPGVHSWVYIIELETGRHYVGETDRPLPERMKEHSAGTATENFLTLVYRPERLVWAFPSFEDQKLRRCMERVIADQYLEELGPHGVRGGKYCSRWDQVLLPTWPKPRPSWIPAPASWTLLQRD